MTPMARSRLSRLLVTGACAASLIGCEKSTTAVTTEAPRRPVAKDGDADADREKAPKDEPSPDEPRTDEPAAGDTPIPPPPPNIGTSTGWVRVEALEEDVRGGWVTGDFEPDRNKIEIRTRGVAQFAMDLSKVPIAWSRKVILSLDGRNAELVQREFDVYHVARDEHNAWIVLER